MKRQLKEIKTEQIKKMFEKETGIAAGEITDILDAFPFDIHVTIHTMDRTFGCLLTFEGRAKRGSFTEEK